MNRVTVLAFVCLVLSPTDPAISQSEATADWESAMAHGHHLGPPSLPSLGPSESTADWRSVMDYGRDGPSMEARELERRTDARTHSESLRAAAESSIGRGIEWVSYGIGLVESARELRDSYAALSEFDAEFDPDFEEGGGPTVPSHCAESEACLACYTSAVEKINFNRFWIERARAIVVSYIRFADAASSFGDSASGIHGVSGLAWQLEGKPQITEAVAQLRQTYREKSEIYLDNLEQSMQELGRCEEEHYGERDWYQRFGYLYVSFMRAKYEGAAD